MSTRFGGIVRKFIALLLLMLFSTNLLADETITIFVKEISYSINNSDVALNRAELESSLKKLKFTLVILDVDYCAEPDTLAYAYLAISNANSKLKDIKLKASGSSTESKCKNV